MTDLTAYESALVERVAKEIREYDADDPSGMRDPAVTQNNLRVRAKHILRALGLLGPSRTAWLAPWEETDAMYDAGHAAFQDPKNHHGDVFGEVYYAMRDAHLKEGGA